MENHKTKCKNCGGMLNSWFTANRVNSVAVDGRLKSNEISCDFVMGCDECSETLRVVPAEEIASQMNAALSAAEPVGAPLELPYRNWRGEISTRKIQPIRLDFGATEWHPEPQWLLVATDIEKNAERSFALKDFNPQQPAPSVAVKALEWRDEPITPSGETLASSVVGLYCIPHSGDRFYLRFRDAVTLGDYSTLDKAKAAAQADYENRIRSALSAQVQDESEIVNCLTSGKPFVFDPATNFCHAADGGAPEHGIKYVPAAQVQDVTGWQPIETAPKDGTTVLLYAPGWDSPKTGWTYGKDEWQDCPYSHKGSKNYLPTHWMPLPAAPAKQEG